MTIMTIMTITLLVGLVSRDIFFGQESQTPADEHRYVKQHTRAGRFGRTLDT